LNLLDHRSDLLVARIDALREAVRRTRPGSPCRFDAWVVLADHMHRLWTPAFAGAGSCRQAMPTSPLAGARSKSPFAKSLPEGEPRSPVMARRGEHGIWQ
jgi:putative transposase